MVAGSSVRVVRSRCCFLSAPGRETIHNLHVLAANLRLGLADSWKLRLVSDLWLAKPCLESRLVSDPGLAKLCPESRLVSDPGLASRF
jgi:hypothetical protein